MMGYASGSPGWHKPLKQGAPLVDAGQESVPACVERTCPYCVAGAEDAILDHAAGRRSSVARCRLCQLRRVPERIESSGVVVIRLQ